MRKQKALKRYLKKSKKRKRKTYRKKKIRTSQIKHLSEKVSIQSR